MAIFKKLSVTEDQLKEGYDINKGDKKYIIKKDSGKLLLLYGDPEKGNFGREVPKNRHTKTMMGQGMPITAKDKKTGKCNWKRFKTFSLGIFGRQADPNSKFYLSTELGVPRRMNVTITSEEDDFYNLEPRKLMQKMKEVEGKDGKTRDRPVFVGGTRIKESSVLKVEKKSFKKRFAQYIVDITGLDAWHESKKKVNRATGTESTQPPDIVCVEASIVDITIRKDGETTSAGRQMNNEIRIWSDKLEKTEDVHKNSLDNGFRCFVPRCIEMDFGVKSTALVFGTTNRPLKREQGKVTGSLDVITMNVHGILPLIIVKPEEELEEEDYEDDEYEFADEELEEEGLELSDESLGEEIPDGTFEFEDKA
jgi:hypothetical protein